MGSPFDAMTAMGKAGPLAIADGNSGAMRLTKTGAAVGAKAHGDFSEGASRGKIFSLSLGATTTTVAAGNIVAAAAAAATQFALFNPLNSGFDIHLLKFGMGVISGTQAAGPVFHGGYIGVPTVASIGGVIRTHYGFSPGGSIAIPMALAAGSALTGGTAPFIIRAANFAATATAGAVPGYVGAIELIDGDIILAPGTGWVPLHSGAGTTLLHGYSITWEEVAKP